MTVILREVQMLSEVSLFSLFWDPPPTITQYLRWDNWKPNVIAYLTKLATEFIYISLKFHWGFALDSFQIL